jgi:hypothetical protein
MGILDEDGFRVGERPGLEMVTSERYYLPKFARIKRRTPKLGQFPPNKERSNKIQMQEKKKRIP